MVLAMGRKLAMILRTPATQARAGAVRGVVGRRVVDQSIIVEDFDCTCLI
jgi:hypothetical protein